MANLIVHGGSKIDGVYRPSGNKNAVLPMLCASLLTEEEVILENVPDISDVHKLVHFFKTIGSEIVFNVEEKQLTVKHNYARALEHEIHLPMGIRSSVLLFAPLLLKLGVVKIDTTVKGCALGVREIDPHIYILTRFGAQKLEENTFSLSNSQKVGAQNIWAEYASVTATSTFLMAASTISERSKLMNAASEPHVQEFCNMLISMGAKIEGMGSSTLEVEGLQNLQGGRFRVPDDHHEVISYLALSAVTGGNLTVHTNCIHHLPLIIRQFEKLGVRFEIGDNWIKVKEWTRQISKPFTTEILPKIEAAPWPYFPADLLPQAIGVAAGCEGEILFWNKVYEGALAWSSELSKLGVRLHLSDPHRLIVFGNNDIRASEVEAPYIIRVVLGLLIVAVQADGVSTIRNADPIGRAHPNFIENLQSLGGNIKWEN